MKDIQNIINNWRSKQDDQHSNQQQRYRDLIARFETLTADEEIELQALIKSLNIHNDKIGQHVIAWRQIKDNEMTIAEISSIEADFKTIHHELNLHNAETELIVKSRHAKRNEINNRLNNRKSDIAQRWAISKETEELRWINRELFFDDPAIVKRASEAERYKRHQAAMNKAALG